MIYKYIIKTFQARIIIFSRRNKKKYILFLGRSSRCARNSWSLRTIIRHVYPFCVFFSLFSFFFFFSFSSLFSPLRSIDIRFRESVAMHGFLLVIRPFLMRRKEVRWNAFIAGSASSRLQWSLYNDRGKTETIFKDLSKTRNDNDAITVLSIFASNVISVNDEFPTK